METKERKTILQKIRVNENSSLSIAQRYYSLLSAISNIKLTEREIQLIAFTSIMGNISNFNSREEFCSLYKSSPPTINNMISKLKKLDLLVKDGGKVKVNPKYLLDFKNNITLQISLINGE